MPEEKNAGIPQGVIDKAVEELKEYGIRLDKIPEIYLCNSTLMNDLSDDENDMVTNGNYQLNTGDVNVFQPNINKTFATNVKIIFYEALKEVVNSDLKEIYPGNVIYYKGYISGCSTPRILQTDIDCVWFDPDALVAAIHTISKNFKENEKTYKFLTDMYEKAISETIQHELIHHSQYNSVTSPELQKQRKEEFEKLKKYFSNYLRVYDIVIENEEKEEEMKNIIIDYFGVFTFNALNYGIRSEKFEDVYEKHSDEIIKLKDKIKNKTSELIENEIKKLEIPEDIRKTDFEKDYIECESNNIKSKIELDVEKKYNYFEKLGEYRNMLIVNDEEYKKIENENQRVKKIFELTQSEIEIKEKGITESFAHFWNNYKLKETDDKFYDKKMNLLKKYGGKDTSQFSDMFGNLYKLRNSLKEKSGLMDKQIMQAIMPFMYHVDVQLNENGEKIKDSTIHRLNNNENEFNEFLELAKKQEDKTKVSEIWCRQHKLENNR